MDINPPGSRDVGHAPTNGGSLDVECNWAAGSIHLRTLSSAEDLCQRKFVRNDLAIGICFQETGSAAQWQLDGKLVLDKVWTSNSGTRDLIVLPPGHEFEATCRGRGRGLWLFIDPLSIDDDDRIRQFAGTPKVDCRWVTDRLSWAIATECRNECRDGFPRGSMFLESASMALLAQLAYFFGRTVVQRSAPIRSLSGPKLRLVLDFIDGNLDRNVSLTEIAHLVGLTPRYFCEMFRCAMGRPPHQYQIEQRIERAKQLLCRSDMPVSDVALAVGFSSQSHLNAFFRRIVGVTPARYRSDTIFKKASY